MANGDAVKEEKAAPAAEVAEAPAVEAAAVVEQAASAPVAAAVVAEPQSQSMALAEFCTRLSSKEKRVELIGGFHHSECLAGHTKDTFENFSARFDKFINQPA